MCDDFRLPFPAWLVEHNLAGRQFKPHRFRRIIGISRRSGSDPAQQRLVVLAVLCEDAAAGMRDSPGRLFQQQALLRRGEIHSPPDVFFEQPVVVTVRVVPEERQLEPILAASRSVTRAVVAAPSEEDRHHVVFEADAVGRLSSTHVRAHDNSNGEYAVQQLIHVNSHSDLRMSFSSPFNPSSSAHFCR